MSEVLQCIGHRVNLRALRLCYVSASWLARLQLVLGANAVLYQSVLETLMIS